MSVETSELTPEQVAVNAARDKLYDADPMVRFEAKLDLILMWQRGVSEMVRGIQAEVKPALEKLGPLLGMFG